jgi:hypothetical protein
MDENTKFLSDIIFKMDLSDSEHRPMNNTLGASGHSAFIRTGNIKEPIKQATQDLYDYVDGRVGKGALRKRDIYHLLRGLRDGVHYTEKHIEILGNLQVQVVSDVDGTILKIIKNDHIIIVKDQALEDITNNIKDSLPPQPEHFQ